MSEMMAVKTTIVSAPGKVLLTGGYLVLDRKYGGLVVATDSRFYVVVRPTQKEHGQNPVISVVSPQFLDGGWDYMVEYEADKEQLTSIKLSPVDAGQPKNTYVECTLSHCFEVAASRVDNFNHIISNGLEIGIVGSNDFYSQREQLAKRSLPLTTQSLASLEPFCATLSRISEVHKTGLGSSAAMITSLVGAVLSHFGAISLPTVADCASGECLPMLSATEQYGLSLVHNTAQFCHCLAQGKIGSGFDVSAAVFGSHAYRRFSPSVLDELLKKAAETETSMTISDVFRVVDPTASARWNNEVEQFHLPPSFNLLLADIDAGSSTPKLVSQVLSWRKASPTEAEALWSELDSYNTSVERYLRELCGIAEANKAGYTDVLNACAARKASMWNEISVDANHANVKAVFVRLYESFQRVRELLREMSLRAGVPIEPPEQTRLLDACMEVPGIVMAGVPGAGGYDAIFCIALSDAARSGVENIWQDWTEMAVGPLLARESNGGLLGIDRIEDIPGLQMALQAALWAP